MSTHYPAQLDHLIYAVPNLADGIAHIEELLEVHVHPGGRHPQWGTANAIVPLGEARYLEILGPDATAPGTSRPLLFGLSGLDRPRLATWAAKARDPEALVAGARGRGVELGSAQRGRRLRPDGTELEWTLTDPLTDRRGGVLPFFIHWPDTDHPGGSGPAQVRLLSLRATHPEWLIVQRELEVLGLDLQVTSGAGPALIAHFETRGKVVTLS